MPREAGHPVTGACETAALARAGITGSPAFAGDDEQTVPRHSTTIFASSVTENPLSPFQVNASVPLSVGDRVERHERVRGDRRIERVEKISSPLYLHENDVMMSRGISRPLVPWRKPVSITCEISVLISITSPRFACAAR